MSGRVGVADQALVASDQAHSGLAPSGFDPSREAAELSERDRRFLIATPEMIHDSADFISRKAGVQNGGREFAGFVRRAWWLFQCDGWPRNRKSRLAYRLSKYGYFVREAAIAIEARRVATTEIDPVHGGADPKDDAHA